MRKDVLMRTRILSSRDRPTGWKESLSDSEAQCNFSARAQAARTEIFGMANDTYSDTGCDH